tara:strand:+ start:47 stop:1231 length:1185 start_codon:yes stop_codon:yes gene_type:complete
MVDRTGREFGTSAPAGYVGDYLRNTIFPAIGGNFNRYYQNMGKADSTPFTYSGERIAGFDPRETYGMQLSDEAVGNYRNFINASTRGLGEANRTAGAAAGVGSQYLQEASNAGRALTDEASNMYRGLGASFDPSSYSSYMNPYTDEVINRTLGDIRDQTNLSRDASRAQAVTGGAFGGSRGRITEADIERGGLRSMGDAAGSLRAQGYSNAMDRAYQEFGRGQNEKTQIAGALGGLGQQAYGMGLGAGQGIAGIGQNLASTYGSTAGAMSGLGTQFANLSAADIDRIMNMGGMGRARNQAGLDLDYSNFVGEYNMPNTVLGNTISAVGAAGPMAGGFSYAGANPTADLASGFGSNFFPSTGGIGSYGTTGTGTGTLGGYTGGVYNNTYGSNMPV